MRTVSRLSAVLTVIAGLLVASTTAASAAVDCTFNNATKTATITLGSDDYGDSIYVGRLVGSKRIGYYASNDGQWRRCSGATTTTTDKVKVIGGDLSDQVYLSLENGPLAPGASNERNGAPEIEVVLDLGAGTDRVTLLGSNGSDRMGFTRSSSAFLNGDDDADVTIAGANEFHLDGQMGNDYLDGRGTPRTQIHGREGSDRILGGPGNDNLYGDGGETSGDGSDIIVGGAGEDDLYADRGSDVLSGGIGSDYLVGGPGNDEVSGGDGGDYLLCEDTPDGADVFDGGSGSDYFACWDRNTKVVVDLDGKADDGAKGEHDNVKPNIERLSGGDGADTLIGTDGPDDIDGNAGADTIKALGGDDDLSGGDGDDTLLGGDGDDYMANGVGNDRHEGGPGNDYIYGGSSNDGRDVFSGGPGSDELSFYGRTNALLIDVTVPGDDGEVGENDNVLPDFEYLTGGTGSDEIRGGGGPESINGGSGAGGDMLHGGGGADILYGGDGIDTLVAGEGWDYLYAGNDDDFVHLLDGGQDYADCGSGTDTVVNADAVELDQLNNCAP